MTSWRWFARAHVKLRWGWNFRGRATSQRKSIHTAYLRRSLSYYCPSTTHHTLVHHPGMGPCRLGDYCSDPSSSRSMRRRWRLWLSYTLWECILSPRQWESTISRCLHIRRPRPVPSRVTHYLFKSATYHPGVHRVFRLTCGSESVTVCYCN